ncbi:hypothetical protein R9C00_20650 [Flammeovirgaceae bacterium SG7u.111]|nr:hypothetical protein [Flammeovirgaceae bacterium SG7u.132]WPO34113.1 hypothetical protein R9C00_20650 [Flammeovirgaceae bacterium SG7u.111]
MNELEYIQDIVCQVLVQEKSKELIYSVLNEFIPEYETINLDYVGKPDDEDYEFESEDEMISCYIETPSVRQAFYWNKYGDNPDKIMVGVNVTSDNQLVFSLTFNGTLKIESEYYLRLKKFLKSNTGVISYVNPAEYDNGNDFKLRYENEIYEFENKIHR